MKISVNILDDFMCGIFAYLGEKEASKICLEGLKKLEYRGYDSSGIGGVKDGKLVIIKEVGKIAKLEEDLKDQDLGLPMAMAHTRWATHGIPSKQNAHPHTDQNNTVAVVHNGVIENYASIKNDLTKNKRVSFSSDTDTEVIAQLTSINYKGDLFKACIESFAQLEGSFALALIHKDHPDQMIATAEKSPLVVGFDPASKELYIASDPSALPAKKLDLYFLEEREVASLTKGKAPLFYDKTGSPLPKKPMDIPVEPSEASKGIFEHYMLKEIFEQDKAVIGALKDRYDEKKCTAIFKELKISEQDLAKIEHILIIACGTSFHAASIAAYLFEEISHISTRVEIASEYRYKTPIIFPNTLVIALSQSGETADTIAAVRNIKGKGAKMVALCNVPGSTLAREVESTIFLHAGPEVAVASTKTFTSQITVLYLLALLLARQRGMSADQGRVFYQQLYTIPEKIGQILEDVRKIQTIAIKYAKHHDFYFLGRGVLYPTALEAALKLKEVAYINAVGYPAGEMKHGPIALLDPTVPVVVFCANEALEQKIISNLMESRARKAPIIVFGWKEFEKDFGPFCEDMFLIPKTTDALACLLLTVATQLFAYFAAKERGAEIDQPRNLAKSVTVE